MFTLVHNTWIVHVAAVYACKMKENAAKVYIKDVNLLIWRAGRLTHHFPEDITPIYSAWHEYPISYPISALGTKRASWSTQLETGWFFRPFLAQSHGTLTQTQKTTEKSQKMSIGTETDTCKHRHRHRHRHRHKAKKKEQIGKWSNRRQTHVAHISIYVFIYLIYLSIDLSIHLFTYLSIFQHTGLKKRLLLALCTSVTPSSSCQL